MRSYKTHPTTNLSALHDVSSFASAMSPFVLPLDASVLSHTCVPLYISATITSRSNDLHSLRDADRACALHSTAESFRLELFFSLFLSLLLTFSLHVTSFQYTFLIMIL